jgi:hypothetical protein
MDSTGHMGTTIIIHKTLHEPAEALSLEGSMNVLDGFIQKYFCDRTCWNAVPEVHSQKGASWNSVPEPLFPGIDITNISPSPTKFLVTMRSGIYSLYRNSFTIMMCNDGYGRVLENEQPSARRN